VELPTNRKVSLGRRSNNAHLNNLHISREQVVFELKPDKEGRILICMTNVRAGAAALKCPTHGESLPPAPHASEAQRGKNSTRVLSIARRKQARVTCNTFCRLVPGDVVELLYDQQGRYAYKVRNAMRVVTARITSAKAQHVSH